MFALNLNGQVSSIRKGEISIYFGWNNAIFSDSDIHFKGSDYDFVLNNASASDRQTPFGIDPYFKLNSITVPQTNMGITFQFNEKVQLSFNVDHMKYVLNQNQIASISGEISHGYGDLAGVYNNTPIELTKDLIIFEHTDGLNYINLGYARTHTLKKVNSFLSLQGNYGGALGVLLPKTNSTLLGKERYDDFHLSGYGASADASLQLNISKWLFLATYLKGGFINMPDIRTSSDTSDYASQNFWFAQYNFIFGLRFNFTSES